MTDLRTSFDTPKQTFSWPRIAGTSFAIALHVVVFMTLMAPVTSQKTADKEDDVTLVNFIEPPKPPPPPPPPPKEPPKTITRIVETPKPTAVPPPPEEPPMVYDTPSPVAIAAPPPAPPAPVAAPADFGGSVDPTGRALNKPVYPPEENRRGITGTTLLTLTYDVTGNVTGVEVKRSSGNRNLDRAAVKAANRWKINPGMRGGVRVAGQVDVPVEFTL
ncbi:MAG: energy transducer TonB [Frankiaceae bacterium]|nr:energy transducer TonB [Arenimonas sp.]